ncbi:hypothetical protein ASPZODRAFT_96897 [Penicilliopsis zonata CBS 506.65]|uniref:Major facilitator superfamily (MFS) profile domain-containing protein n=1 Tax=Penicilliopsis zonata CBS 506.65 TaxID=1073090 RepID=A0A1L9SHK2_9EURO|nr:hypothetical protein ASPZODRAFT_96897 [Penicilliopsis zonata CBS 506.65]OJJ46593.1 hypothetical protein ASPZODRAFT_96897 [Penicilliopsis zonata CBS 506.65]
MEKTELDTAKSWVVVTGAFFGLFVTLGWTNCVGVFQAYYKAHQLSSMSPSTVSWIPSVSMFIIFITGPFVGRLFDRVGPRPLLAAGTLLLVGGLMFTSLSREYYQFLLAQGICSMLGASMILYPCLGCVARAFTPRRRALAMGVTTSGSSLGGVILPILIDRLIPKVGFPWAMRISAFMLLGLLVITNLTVKSFVPLKPPAHQGIWVFVRPLASPVFLCTVLASFFYAMGMFIPITFMQTYAESVGMSGAGYIVSIYNAASLFGRILPGYAADRFGSFNISFVAACTTTILVFALWLPTHTVSTAIAFAACFGFTSGTYTALTPALVALICEYERKHDPNPNHHSLNEIGTRSGTLYAFTSVAALTGSPIGGALVSAAGGGYNRLQIFTGAMLAAGSACYFAARMAVARGNPSPFI